MSGTELLYYLAETNASVIGEDGSSALAEALSAIAAAEEGEDGAETHS